jgi:hypothetical protein
MIIRSWPSVSNTTRPAGQPESRIAPDALIITSQTGDVNVYIADWDIWCETEEGSDLRKGLLRAS